MARILITGGAGLLGMALAKMLKADGHTLVLLSRSAQRINPYDAAFTWNPEKAEIDQQALDQIDAIVHLAGAGIADKPWTEKRKQEILDSRVNSAQLLLNTLKQRAQRINVLVSASAVGWYGAQTTSLLHLEEEPAAIDFMGETCRRWEAAADDFSSVANRIVKIRTGVVLDANGGALPELMKPFKFGFGAVLGSGKQQIPWIHIEDIARIFREALFNEAWSGAYNATATEQCSNRTFTQTLGKVLKKPVFPIGVPSLGLRLVLGEMSAVVLEGSRISNAKLRSTGFLFKHPELQSALHNLVHT